MSELSLLPFNASALEKHLEATMCRASEIPVPVATLWRPDTCPESLLPWLAWALSVDTWDSTWSTEIKRRVIEDSVAVHRTKGTLASIRRVLAGLNIQAEISEWFEHDGPPYTFRLTAWTDEQDQGREEPILNGTVYRNLVRIVDQVKPVRAHYDFRVGARFDAGFNFGAGSFVLSHSRIESEAQVQAGARSVVAVPTAFRVVSYVRVNADIIVSDIAF